MNQEDKSQIDELNRSLYSRNTPEIRTKRKFRFGDIKEDNDIKTDWEHRAPLEEIDLNKKYKDKSMSFFTKLLVFSIIIFFLALGIGAYLLFNGSNIVSANNIDININTPISVAGGEPVSFDIEVVNRNNIKLETVDLSIDFPSGTVDAIDTSKELKSYRELIPDIESGGKDKKTMNIVVYGEENSKKEILVRVEYRVKGSTSVFKKEKIFDLLISTSPLTLSVESFKEVNSGQDFEIAVTMNSNSKEIIKNVLLKTIYPFGFSYTSSDIKPFVDTNIWKIGDIPPNGKKVIKIKGKIDGQDDEMRAFRFIAGAQSSSNPKVIGTEYISTIQEISIKKPFISVGVSLDGDSESTEYIGSFDKTIDVDVNYFNNLPEAILDGEIHVKLSGTAFEKSSISPGQGLYKSAQNEIVWNSITTSELKNIGAGNSGNISFSITPRNLTNSAKLIINPDITMDISVKANRNSETNVPESIISSARRHIKIASDISLGGQVVRSIGPFSNTGPIPPKVEQKTSYTVIWTVDNTSSGASNVRVTSGLPSYVKWLEKISPANEDINYNSVTGEIVWNVGSVGTYTLNNSSRKQVSFQVDIEPSINQVNQILNLVNESTLTAQDDFTNQTLNSTLNPLNTRFGADPVFKDGDEKVIK